MKTFMIIASLMCFTLNANSQQLVEITNGTNCDWVVQMYSVESKTCASGPVVNYFMASGQGTLATAAPGYEWIYAEVSSDPYCPGTGFAIGTPMQCSSTCTWNVPSNVTIPSNGCNSCLPNVNGEWIDHCGHPGTLHLSDF